MGKLETFLELSKYDTETKWENTVGKIAAADLLDAELPQIFDLWGKKISIWQCSICKAQYSEDEVTCVTGETIMR